MEYPFKTFSEACNYIQNLPYKRNENKFDINCVLNDNGGTCSTKHAFLKQYADENNIDGIKLMMGIYKMNTQNTEKITSVLDRYGLKEMPEAHNYLKINGEIKDFTRPDSKPEDFINDLIEETEINPNQITDFKVKYHKNFLEKYLKENSQILYNLTEFWAIREACISALQK